MHPGRIDDERLLRETDADAERYVADVLKRYVGDIPIRYAADVPSRMRR